MTAVDEYERTASVMGQTGATYRQLQYWVEMGYLNPINARRGSGVPMLWPREEIQAAKRIAALLSCGVHLEAAAAMCRDEAEILRAMTIMAGLLNMEV